MALNDANRKYLDSLKSGGGSSFVSDLPKFANIGARQFVGSLGAIPEGIGAATGRPQTMQAGQAFRQKQENIIQQDIVPTLSKEGKKVFSSGIEDVFKGDVGVGKFVLGKSAQFAPGTLAGGVAGGLIRSALPAVSRGVAFGAGEALVTAPSGASRQASEIDAASSQKLLETSKAYQAAYAKHGDKPEAVRDAIARAATKAQALPTGGVSSAMATIAGSVLAGRLSKGAAGGVFGDGAEKAVGIISGAAKGARREAVQEAAQSFFESIAGDVTTSKFTDPSAAKLDNLLKNAALSSAEGALIGSSLGASIGAVQGRLNKMSADKMQKAEESVNTVQNIEKKLQTEAARPVDEQVSAGAQEDRLKSETEVAAEKEAAIENTIQAAKNQATVDALSGKQVARPLNEMGRVDLVEEAKSLNVQYKGVNSERLRDNIQIARDAAAGVKSLETDRFNTARELESIGATIGATVPKNLRKDIIRAFSGVDSVQDKITILEAIQEKYARSKSGAIQDTLTEYRRRLDELQTQQAPATEQAQVAPEVIQRNELEADDLTPGVAKINEETPSASTTEVAAEPAVDQEVTSAQAVEEVAAPAELQEPASEVAQQPSGFKLPEFNSVVRGFDRAKDIPIPVQTVVQEQVAQDKLPGLAISSSSLPESRPEVAGVSTAEPPVIQEGKSEFTRASKLDRPKTVEERILEAASIDDVVREVAATETAEDALTDEETKEFMQLSERHPEIVEKYLRIGAAKGWSNSKTLSAIRDAAPVREKAAAVKKLSEEEQRRRNIEAAEDSIRRGVVVNDAVDADVFLSEIDREFNKVDKEFLDEVDSVLDAYFSNSAKQAVNTKITDIPDVKASPSSDIRTKGKTVSAESIRKQLAGKLPEGSIKINVVGSIKSLPPRARKYLESKGLEGTARGLYIPGTSAATDSIYVIASNISNIQEATFVALHEAVHRGLRKVFGNKLSNAMDQVYSANAKVKQDVDARMKSGGLSKAEATEEVLADMAREGRVRNLKLWDKVVSYINNWIAKVFDRPVVLTDRQVEELVAGAQSVGLEADVEVVGDRVPRKVEDIRTSLRFNDGPAQAMDRVDGLLSDAKEFVESRIPSVTGFMHKANMYFSTGSHISEFYGRILGGSLQRLMANWQSALGRTSAMVSKMNKDVSLNVKSIDTLSDNPQSQKALYQLMGESTRLGIYPNRPFEEQPWLTAKDKQAYNNLKSLYDKKGVAEVYDKLQEHTRRDFDMSYASLLRTLAFTFEAPQEIWSRLDPLKAMSEDAVDRKSFYDDIAAAEDWMSQNEGSDAANALTSMREFRAAKLRGPYFHLGRYGDFFVRYKVNNPLAVQAAMDASNQFNAFEYQAGSSIMNRFEQESQWTTQTSLLRKLQDSGAIEGLEVGKIEENLNALDSDSPSFIQSMLTRVDADTRIAEDQKRDTKELIRRIFVEMMPEVSGGKQLARRKGVPGYDADMRRSFVKKASATAYLVAHNTVRPEIMEAIKDMRFELNKLKVDPTQDVRRIALANDVFNHLKRRLDNSMQPLDTPALDRLSSLGYSMFLASSVPYILTNLLQPMQVGLPVIGGRHGFTKTLSEMFKSSKKAASILKESINKGWDDAKSWKGILDAHIAIDRADLSPGERKAMHAFIDSGNLEFTQAHGLGRIERGEAEGWNTVAKTFGAASHFSEALNRISVGLTAFNLEVEKLKDSGLTQDQIIDKAITYGMQSIVNTQFNYDPENRSIAFSKKGMFGELTPLFTGFMQFNMQMLQLLSSLVTQSFSNSSVEKAEARKALAGLTATVILMAGAMGLPGVSLLGWAYGGLAGSDDDPKDFRADFISMLSGMIGNDAANILAHGAIDKATGGTFSTRLSLADIVPFSQFLSDRRDLSDKLESGALAMLGPSIGAAANIVQGAEKVIDGDLFKGMVMMMPSAFQGFVKAPDLAINGFTTLKGSSLPIKPNGWDVFLQALNITPNVKTELQRNTRSFTTIDKILDNRKSELSRKMADALEKGDLETVQKIGAEMAEFQLNNPDKGTFDPDRILKQRLKRTETAVLSGTGVMTDSRDMGRLLQMLQGNTTTNLRERLSDELRVR